MKVLIVSLAGLTIINAVSLVRSLEDDTSSAQTSDVGPQAVYFEGTQPVLEVISSSENLQNGASMFPDKPEGWLWQLQDIEALLAQFGSANPSTSNNFRFANPSAPNGFSSPNPLAYDSISTNPGASNSYNSPNPLANDVSSSNPSIGYDPRNVNPLAKTGVRQVIDNPVLDCPQGYMREIYGQCRQLW